LRRAENNEVGGDDASTGGDLDHLWKEGEGGAKGDTGESPKGRWRPIKDLDHQAARRQRFHSMGRPFGSALMVPKSPGSAAAGMPFFYYLPPRSTKLERDGG
jgi:hypothetical protein